MTLQEGWKIFRIDRIEGTVSIIVTGRAASRLQTLRDKGFITATMGQGKRNGEPFVVASMRKPELVTVLNVLGDPIRPERTKRQKRNATKLF